MLSFINYLKKLHSKDHIVCEMFLKSISTLSDLIQLVLEYTFTLYTLYLFTLLAANRTVISNKLLFKKKHIRYNLYLINIVEPSFFY